MPLRCTTSSMLLLRSIRISSSAPWPLRSTCACGCPGPASPKMMPAIAATASERHSRPSHRPVRSGGSHATDANTSVSARRLSKGSSASGSSSRTEGRAKSKPIGCQRSRRFSISRSARHSSISG